MTSNEPATAQPPVADAAVEESEVRHRLALRDYGILLAFVALFVGLALATDTFFTERNLTQHS